MVCIIAKVVQIEHGIDSGYDPKLSCVTERNGGRGEFCATSLGSVESHQNMLNIIRILRVSSEYLESHQNLWNRIRIFGITSESLESH